MKTGDRNLELVGAVSGLAKTFNLDLVAEGVETEEQRSILKSMSYRYAQGNYFGKAMESDLAVDLLVSKKNW